MDQGLVNGQQHLKMQLGSGRFQSSLPGMFRSHTAGRLRGIGSYRRCSTLQRRSASWPAASMSASTAQKESPQGGIFTLVGSGRIATALQDMGGGEDTMVKRGQRVETPSGPIIVCTRNDDLQAVLEATPDNRHTDLVFVQNGMLQPWLDARGLGDNTQALVFFAVPKLGATPQDGKTDTNPEGLTAATGKHAEAFAQRLHAGGLSCKVLDKVQYKKAMLEKLIWICAFMLVGARHKCNVGEVESRHTEEAKQLIGELAAAGGRALDVTLDGGVVERLCAYSRTVSTFPTAIKEFPWRNGFFYDLSREAEQQGQDDPCPLHTAGLQEVGAI